MKLHPELQMPFIYIVTILTIINLIILKFTGSHSIYKTIGVTSVLSVIIALITTTLANWNYQFKITDFFFHFFILTICSVSIALFIKYIILKNLNIIYTKNPVSLVLCIVVLVVGIFFLLKYERYHWEINLQKNENLKLIQANVADFQSSRRSFASLDDKNNMYSTKEFIGMPNYVSTIFYNPESHKLYSLDTEIANKILRKYIGYGILYPFTNQAKYTTISLILSNDGIVKLNLANSKEIVTIYNSKCSVISPEDLPEYLLDRYETEKVMKLYHANEYKLNTINN